jgi:NADH-quinone oxidoreductase subunit C
MSGQAFVERLKKLFGDKITGANFAAIDPWVEVAPAGLVEVCRYLRDEPDLRFNFLNCISGVDYFEPDAKKAAKNDWQPHTEVVYHLSSLPKKTSLVLKVILPRWKNDKPGELPEVPSVAGVWSTADWHEREAIPTCGASCAPRIGSVTRCARIMKCRWSITASAAGNGSRPHATKTHCKLHGPRRVTTRHATSSWQLN